MGGDAPSQYVVSVAAGVRKDVRRLGHDKAARALRSAREKLSKNPEAFGTPLTGELAGYWRLAAGQTRVVYSIEAERVEVWVLALGKRAAGDRENVYERFPASRLENRREGHRRKRDRGRPR